MEGRKEMRGRERRREEVSGKGKERLEGGEEGE